MNIGEMLSICTFRANHPGNVVRGGRANVTCDDLMHALGMIQVADWKRNVVRMKYMGEDHLRAKLEAVELLALTTKIAAEKGYREERGEKPYSGMVHLAMEEYLDSEVCLCCNGQKSKVVDSKPIVCPQCEGLGVPVRDMAWQARVARIHPIRWANVWVHLYPYVKALPFGAQDTVFRAMSHRLSQDVALYG